MEKEKWGWKGRVDRGRRTVDEGGLGGEKGGNNGEREREQLEGGGMGREEGRTEGDGMKEGRRTG